MKRRDRQQKQAERQKNRQQVRQTRESRRKGSQDKRERDGNHLKVTSLKVTQIQEEVSGMNLSSDESDATCAKCGLLYSADSGMWIACDLCENWFNLSCTNIIDSKKLPDVFYCENCVVNPCVSETDRDLCNDKEWLTSVCLIMGTLSHISITNKWYLL